MRPTDLEKLMNAIGLRSASRYATYLGLFLAIGPAACANPPPDPNVLGTATTAIAVGASTSAGTGGASTGSSGDTGVGGSGAGSSDGGGGAGPEPSDTVAFTITLPEMTLAPGEEYNGNPALSTLCLALESTYDPQSAGPDGSGFLYRGYQMHANPGMHHAVIIANHEVEVPGAASTACGGHPEEEGLAASTSLNGKSFLPEGVSVQLAPFFGAAGSIHYLNLTGQPLAMGGTVDIFAADPSKVEHFASRIHANNTAINVPAHASSSSTATCLMPFAVDVIEISPHTHQHSVGFSVWISGGPRDGELVYTYNGVYDQIPTIGYAPYIHLEAGEGLTYQCDFANEGAVAVKYGPGGADFDMCTMNALYIDAQGPYLCANKNDTLTASAN